MSDLTRVETLKAGDQAHLWGEDRDLIAVQVSGPTVILTTDEPAGEPYTMADLDGDTLTVQPRRTFLYPRGFMVEASTAAELAA